jgi:hypothetical protein
VREKTTTGFSFFVAFLLDRIPKEVKEVNVDFLLIIKANEMHYFSNLF